MTPVCVVLGSSDAKNPPDHQFLPQCLTVFPPSTPRNAGILVLMNVLVIIVKLIFG